MLIFILEYLAFGSSLTCVYLYGHNRVAGAWVGMVTAALFIAWGASAGVYAAMLTNVVFFGLHFWNLRKARAELRGATHADLSQT